MTHREKIATQRVKNNKNHTESGVNGQNNAVSDLNAKCEQKHTERGKNIYSNQVRSKISRELASNACNLKEFNKTDLDLPEMSPSFEKTFKTKFSEMHNFAANHLLKTVTVNMENVK